jgi:ATP-binding cassette subfamily B protein
MKNVEFPLYYQDNEAGCGPACLRMVAKHYGKNYSQEYLNDLCLIGSEGTTILHLRHAAMMIGFNAIAVTTTFELLRKLPLPAIAHWGNLHFVVIYNIRGDKIYIADPLEGLVSYTKRGFLASWQDAERSYKNAAWTGVLLLLEPISEFNENQF